MTLEDRTIGTRGFRWVLIADADRMAKPSLGFPGGNPDLPEDNLTMAALQAAKMQFPQRKRGRGG